MMIGYEVLSSELSKAITAILGGVAPVSCEGAAARIEGACGPKVEGAMRLGIESRIGWKRRRVRMACLSI
jgi:hypothetical protein